MMMVESLMVMVMLMVLMVLVLWFVTGPWLLRLGVTKSWMARPMVVRMLCLTTGRDAVVVLLCSLFVDLDRHLYIHHPPARGRGEQMVDVEGTQVGSRAFIQLPLSESEIVNGVPLTVEAGVK